MNLMSNNTNTEETNVDKTNEVEDAKRKEVSEKIRGILEEENYALQPFIAYSPYGIQPSVRLIKLSEDNANETGNSPEAEGDSSEDGATEPQ